MTVSSASRACRRLMRFAVLLLPFAPLAAAATTAEEDMVWTGGLRAAFFGDRPIVQSDEVIALAAPDRADDAAIVPISITAKIPQTPERYIKNLFLFVDKNPGPLAGTFRFTPASGRADLALRIRVNAYSPIRAIAETNLGELYMSRRFIKASGGCSAPAGSDIDATMARLGRIRLRTDEGPHLADPTAAQLMISHPNLSGLQMDQLTQFYAPAHFVRQVRVTFADEPVFSADVSFAISENPSFRFYYVPDRDGELTAEVLDTKDLRFTRTVRVKPGQARR